MFEINQFLSEEVCLKCQGCCRFREKESIWQPSLLKNELGLTVYDNKLKKGFCQSKKIKTLSFQESFICWFHDTENNRCRIYPRRPFECRLYPFLINKTKKNLYLAADLNCPFIADRFQDRDFQEHAGYLLDFLSQPKIALAIKQSPHIFTDYTGENILNISRISF